MYKIIENPPQELWDSYVQKNEKATIFHTTAWKNVIQKSLDYTPLYVAILRDGEIRGILPLFEVVSIFTGKRLVSLPYSVIAGPLAESDKEKELLIEYAEKKRESLKYMYLELRTRDGINTHQFSAEERSDFLNFSIELKNDIDRMWSLITRYARKKVRNAEKSGIRIRVGDSEEDIKSFYELNLTTRKKHGTPSFSIQFFKNIIKELKGKLYFAYLENKTIEAFLIVPFKDKVYSMYSGADDQYKHLHPSDFLTWHAIKWASLNGFKYLDIGRASTLNKGLISFKEKWGSQAEVLRYYYLPRSSFVSSRSGFKFTMVNTLFKKLPISIARILGPPLIKRLG